MPTGSNRNHRNLTTEVKERNRNGGKSENALKREKRRKFKEAELFQQLKLPSDYDEQMGVLKCAVKQQWHQAA